MGAHVQVRAYRLEDAQECCAVINRAVEEMDGLNGAARRLIPVRNVPSVLHAELGHLYTVVCELDGRCVGVGALDDTEIKRVYVDPAAQGLGVGEWMMSALEAEARRRGAQARAANAWLCAMSDDDSPLSLSDAIYECLHAGVMDSPLIGELLSHG